MVADTGDDVLSKDWILHRIQVGVAADTGYRGLPQDELMVCPKNLQVIGRNSFHPLGVICGIKHYKNIKS